jgi:hypothetical protein
VGFMFIYFHLFAFGIIHRAIVCFKVLNSFP